MPTIRDVARESGVSIATVSVVLSGANRTVASATRERVLTAARQLQYRPNRSARALSTGRTHLVALWINEVRRAYFSTMAHHVEQELRLAGYDYLRIGGGQERDAGEWCGTCDGILALDSPANVQKYLHARQQFQRRGRGPIPPPIVSIGTNVCDETDFVGVDLGYGARLATERLLGSGCRRIVFVTPVPLLEKNPARRDGYDQVMRSAGQTPEHWIIGPQALRAPAYQSVAERLGDQGCPDAFFCFNDEMAMGVYRALREAGRRVPNDVQVIGCDGIDEGEFMDPALTTITHPFAAQVVQAVALLCRRIREPEAPLLQEWLLPELTVRASG